MEGERKGLPYENRGVNLAIYRLIGMSLDQKEPFLHNRKELEINFTRITLSI